MQRTCTLPGCNKPHRARGLCATHYNQTHQTPEQRHPKVSVACAHCGKPCEKGKHRSRRYAQLFCTLECRDASRAADGSMAESMAKARDAAHGRKASARRRLTRAARGTTGSTWISGTCPRCGSTFVGRLGSSPTRYCSITCKRRVKSSRRRARKRGAVHIPYSRIGIFERDGYRCHLCKRLTIPTAVVPHPRAPVIDHLIPLGEGDDAAYNVATACFLCNSTRREVGQAQLLLFG